MDYLQKKIPIGQEDFGNIIRNGYYFVDKTLLIKDILEQHGFVNLITRPRRFGKTLNMSILQHFFEYSSEDIGELFHGLNISTEKELCQNHMGKYPVISMSFMNAKRNTFESAFASLRAAIIEEYERHSEVIDAVSETAKVSMKNKIDCILNGSSNIDDYTDSIRVLSKILRDYYNQSVIILIDEYDVPLEAGYTNGYYAEVLDFVRSLLNFALKSNPNLEFAVLTGCLKLSKESVFTGLNNFSIFSLTDPQFTKYFGFNADEVLQMLKHYGLADRQDEIREWYDGYTISSFEMYNPWSVIKQINEYLHGVGQPIAHWANTSGNDIIKAFVDKATRNTKEELEELMAGKSIEKRIVEELTYDEVFNNVQNLWTFLFSTGYLTASNVTIENASRYARLRIPNKEVHYIFENKIKLWFNETAVNFRDDLYKAMLQKNGEQLQDVINDILYDSISFMDYSENYYHGIMAGLLAGSDFNMKSNRETGLGRADITLTDKTTAIIIELKVASSVEVLEAVCRKALEQINTKQYAMEFRKKEIIKIGISFCKKECAVLIE